MVQTIAVGFFGLVAIWLAITVFRTSSMMRSALALLGTMTSLGMLFLALEAEFLGVLQIMMMATEMAVMAVFMVMFMMDPGGLGKMEMTHQKKVSLTAGIIGGLAAGVLSFLVDWGALAPTAPDPARQVHDLGIELMTRSMLIFETAGVTILISMIAATMLAIARQTHQE